MMRKVLDESMVEVNKSKERLYLLFVRWFRPVCYTSHFYRVHLYMIFGYNQSEVFDPCFFKFTFLGSEEESGWLPRFWQNLRLAVD